MSTIFSEKLFARFQSAFRPQLRAAGLDESIFTVPDMEIPVDKYMRLLELVAERDDPCIGLRMGQEMEPTDLGVLGHAMLASRDVRQMLETLSCFVYIFAQDNAIRLDLSRDRAVVSYHPLAQNVSAHQRDVDFAVCGIAKCISTAAGRTIPPRHVEFEHRKPSYGKAYTAAFGCPVQFERGGNRLHYDRSTMDVPVASHDARLYEALHFYLVEKLKSRQQDDDLIRKLKHLITTSLHGGLPELAVMARQLGLSERTLQRRLAEQGIVFNDLVDGTRKAIALEYLRDSSYRLTDIAQIVGYNEASSFTRACRRWTDMSPTQLRRHRAATAGS